MMLIYSQDGRTMYSSLHVVMIYWDKLKMGPCVVSVAMTDGSVYTLGEYSTCERTKDAFFDLRQALVHSDPYFIMPADKGGRAEDEMCTAIREVEPYPYDQTLIQDAIREAEQDACAQNLIQDAIRALEQDDYDQRRKMGKELGV